jgi:predicted flap endonuclease-1-like 5' DNA nuclease
MIQFTPQALALAAVAFFLGLLIGRIVWGGAVARANRLAAELATGRSTLADTQANRLRLERDLAGSRDQIKPLADEVDRLKRENARLTMRTTAAPITAVPEAHDRAIPVALPDGARSELMDLRLLKGVGDKLAQRLADLGVRNTAEMAALSPVDAERIDGELGPFAGRIGRDQLIGQARLLADGHVTEFEARYGRIERVV